MTFDSAWCRKTIKKYIYYHFSASYHLSCSCVAGVGLAVVVGCHFLEKLLRLLLPASTQNVLM